MAEKRNRIDLLNLIVSSVSIPLIWYFILGWRFDHSMVGGDGFQNFLPYFKSLFASNGSWRHTIVDPSVLGGVELHEVAGTLPIYKLYSLFGFSLTAALNSTVVFTQILYSFFVLRIVDYFCIQKMGMKILAIIMTAFAPFMAWKLGQGHFIMIWGSLPFLIIVSSLFALASSTLSHTFIVITFLSVITCLTSAGQQLQIYSLVFGSPIIVGLALSLWPNLKKNGRGFGLLFLVLCSGFLVSLPRFSGMVKNALSGDVGRSLSGDSIIYSYISATARDWLSSIPWSLDLFPIGRTQNYWHEVNYAFGPIVIMLLLMPRQFRALSLGLIISFVLAVLFSMDNLLTSWLPEWFTILRNFRVPNRAIIPFCLVAVPLSVGLLFSKIERESKPVVILGGLAASLVIYFIPGWIREIILWSATVFFIFAVYKKKFKFLTVIPFLLAFGFSAGSIASYSERLSAFFPLNAALFSVEHVGSKIIKQQPRLSQPLTRAKLEFVYPEFSVNTGWLGGLSTLDGYWFPQRRFIDLVFSLEQNKPEYTVVNFNFAPTLPMFKILSALYNVCCVVRYKDEHLSIDVINAKDRPAWFSLGVKKMENIEAITRGLRSNVYAIYEKLRERLLIDGSDKYFVQNNPPLFVDPTCSQGKIRAVKFNEDSKEILLSIYSPSLCPVTVATNFSSNYTVAMTGSSNGKKLTSFPAYVSLLGFLAVEGEYDVVIKAVQFLPDWATAAMILGWVLFGLTFYLMKPENITTNRRHRR